MLLLAGLASIVRSENTPATADGSASLREATPAESISVAEGFRVERLCSAQPGQGSWVAMCFDDSNHLYVSDERSLLLRIGLPGFAASAGSAPDVQVVSPEWGAAQGLLYLKGSLYAVKHGSPDLILRLTDTDGDGVVDRSDRFFEFPEPRPEANPWREHGVHGIVASPDGTSLYVVCGDRNPLPCDHGRAPRRWNRDSWGGTKVADPFPGGWVMRIGLDGKDPEWVCHGLRNAYDIAFNGHGDLFAFDSDLEFTLGMPTYRPTAIRQIVSGADGGWAGSGPAMQWHWPARWEDIQPPVQNIGPGSPTGVCFGHGSRFPATFQHALFAADWSYGRLFAVHLQPRGAGYTADFNTFLSAQGLPIADLAVSPADGTLYFVTGGRGTQSGLYRVSYVGQEATDPAPLPPLPSEAAALRQLRLTLERLHGAANPEAIGEVWPHLGHQDREIRAAARIALEWQPTERWRSRATAETDPRRALPALIALARSTDGDLDAQREILDAIGRLDIPRLSTEEQSWLVRLLAISSVRHQPFPPATAAELVARLEPLLPTSDPLLDRDIVAACVALGSMSITEKALTRLEQATSQDEQVFYAEQLLAPMRRESWTAPMKDRLLAVAASQVAKWRGGSQVRPLRERIIRTAIDLLSPDERQARAALIEQLSKPAAASVESRPFVKTWTIDDFTTVLTTDWRTGRDLNHGQRVFSAAQCVRCHAFRGDGGLAGPDLTAAGGRYSPRDLLDNTLHPSKVINEQYAMTVYVMEDGRQIIGRIVNMVGDTIMVATDPVDPGGSEVRFTRGEVESMTASPTSLMPDGLLNTFTADDVLDLLAYLTQPPRATR
ncbi:MAG: c-type cytochrome [Planctomycetia bacterium]